MSRKWTEGFSITNFRDGGTDAMAEGSARCGAELPNDTAAAAEDDADDDVTL